MALFDLLNRKSNCDTKQIIHTSYNENLHLVKTKLGVSKVYVDNTNIVLQMALESVFFGPTDIKSIAN